MTQREKFLVTGVTGQVALPVALALAHDHEVWGAARFTDAKAKARLEEAGVRCATVDLVSGDVAQIPDDVTAVVHFAVAKTNSWDGDLDANAGGVLALMERCQGARAFLHCSSTAVYQPNGHRAFREDDPLGDNHRVYSFLETYSISKIAAEAAARYGARRFQLPTTIARLNVPYGDNGGWPAIHLDMLLGGMAVPVHTDAPSQYNPIHEDDIIASVPKLLDAAGIPPTVVNWGGDDVVSIEEWCTYLAELVGIEPTFDVTDQTLESVTVDLTRAHELIGPTKVHWKDGMRRQVAARHPELLRA
jgi:nucleoside-diphosphate-sugar epimerase